MKPVTFILEEEHHETFHCFFSFIVILLAAVTGCGQAATAEPTAIPAPSTPVPPTSTPSPLDVVNDLHWFSTSAFLYHGSQNIYFDPITLDGDLPKADLILVTHAHTDHWSVADLLKVIGPDTTLVIGPNVSNVYEANQAELGIPATILAEGESIEVNGVQIRAVPAYDTSFHQRTAQGVGFLVTVDGKTFYHSGGTYAYPEMADYQCDVAFVPYYATTQVQEMAAIIPAKVIIVEHTSYYAAKAMADLLTQDSTGEKLFVALETGPYQP